MQNVINCIKEMIQDVSGIDRDEIETDCNLFSLGLDSLMLVQIKKRIDQEYQIELPMGRVMSDLDTIEKIAQFIVGEECVETGNSKEKDEKEEVLEAKPEHLSELVEEDIERLKKPNEAVQSTALRKTEENLVSPVAANSLQGILEMQLRVMADSLQSMAQKQLEAVSRLEMPVIPSSDTSISKKDSPVIPSPDINIPKKEFPQINFRAVKLEHDIFTGRQKEFILEFIKKYNNKTKKSKEYARKNRKQFCDWIASLNFRTDFKELIYPIVSDHSQGSKFWDLDGNRYLDMAIGYGVHYFGHRPQFIVDALNQQIAEGYETGPQTDLGGDVSRLLCKITGTQRAAFCNTGSEAVMAALRIARTVNKKPKIVMFRGAYHGNFDCVLAESLDGVTFPTSPGTMYGMVEDVIVLEYDKEESLKVIRERGDEIAAVIVEPVQSRNPGLQPREFLHELRRVTKEISAALIFDEMITGFRICPGGCQEYFGVEADMATYGKIVGGGLPIGVVAGKARYLDAVDGGYWNYGDNSYPEKEMTFFAGTFCKHPLSMAASKAVLEFIDQNNGEIQKQVNQLTRDFVEQANAYFQEDAVPLKVQYFGSEFRFESFGRYDLKRLPAEIELFFYLLMEKGVYIWEKRTCFFSAAHTREDANFFLNAIKKSVKEMRDGGFPFTFEKTNDSVGSEKKNYSSSNVTEQKVIHGFSKTCRITKAQERYYLLSQMESSEAGTHLTSAFLLTGPFKQEKVTGIFQQIVDGQEALRTCYTFEHGELVQKIYDSCKVEIEFIEGEETKLNQYVEEFVRPFDLSKPPLMHVRVVKLSEEKHLLMFDIHHSISDGYSCTLITKQFMDLYEEKPFCGTGLPFQDYLKLQEDAKAVPEYLESMNYWKEVLGEQDLAVSFPEDYQRMEKNNVSGKMITGYIEHGMLIALKKLARDKKCSLYHVLFGAFSLLLHKMTGRDKFVVGTPVQMREERFMNTVGYLTNTVVIYNKIEDTWTLEEYLDTVKRNCASSLEHAMVPFADLVALAASYSKINHNPIFDTMFVYENGEERVNHIADLKCDPIVMAVNQSFFDLTFEVVEERQRLTLHLTYKTSLYQEDTANGILSYYEQALREILANPEETIAYYLSQYTEEWNDRRENKKLLLAFEQQSNEKKQQVIAQSYSGKALTKLEAELVGYWKECLHVSSVDMTENFFDMGGSSIDAMNLIDKLKKKYSISIMDFFKYPTIEKLAQKIQRDSQGMAGEASIQLGLERIANYHGKTEEGQMPIAIIGMAGRFPKSHNIEEFWKNLEEGRECIQFFEREELLEAGISEEELDAPNYIRAKGVLEDAECFDAAFFEYSPKEAEKMDPQIRVFHECAWNALEDAGYTPDSLLAGQNQSQNIGVFAGIASNYTWMSQIYEPTSDSQERIERIALNDKDYAATRISYKMNLTGPSYGIQTACSSSLTSIHLACRSLELGECEMALAGGVSIMLPEKTGYAYEEGIILSKDGHCRVFDKDATGTVFSDGAGVILLKPLEKAIADKDYIYAVIRGTASNNDGNRKAGYTAPSIEGQADVIRKALEHAQVDASTITYVEAHGTGTHLGDPIEVEGLKEVYPREETPYCALGSLKSNFGHLDAAAGVAGVIKASLALKYHKIPGSIYCDIPNPEMHLEESPFFVPKETLNWEQKKQEDGTVIPRRAGVTSLGFGGTNAHVILEEYEEKDSFERDFSEQKKQLFLLSGRTKAALERRTQDMIGYMQEHPDADLNRMAYTLQMGRKAFTYRKMILASDREELLSGLCGGNRKVPVKVGTVEKEKGMVVFLFTGQGSQYVNMARELYEKDVIFKAYLDECFEIARELVHGEIDYKTILFPEEGMEEESSHLINETKNAQVILFMIEYTMASFLIHLGILPDALLGHSLGEYVAACIAGVFSVEHGLKLVIQRANLMQKAERGGMDALNVTEEKARELITNAGCHLDIATVNGKENCVVSGSFVELVHFEQYATLQKVEFSRLKTSHAFHSYMMEPLLKEFTDLVEKIPKSPPKIPYISNFTGTWVTEEVTDSNYWCQHLRHTVRFYDGVKTLLERKCIFVEAGPGKVLSTLVKHNHFSENGNVICNMIRHPKEQTGDVCYLMERIGILWCNGVAVNFQVQYQENSPKKLPLPGYSFHGQQFKMPGNMLEMKKTVRPMSDWLYRPCLKVRPVKMGVINLETEFLVLSEQGDLFQILTEKLEENGMHYSTIFHTNVWEERMQEFVAGLSEKKKEVIVLNLMPFMLQNEESCFWELIRHVQILGNLEKVRYFALTKESRRKEELITSLVNGICSAASKEYDTISMVQLEVSEKESIGQIADRVLEECTLVQEGSYLKLRNGLRLEVDEEMVTTKEYETSVIRENGNYVITGGLGGIGRYLADYLMETYHATVLLLAKSPLPEETSWDTYLKEHKEDDETALKIKAIKKWREQNRKVSVQYCDICEKQEVERLIYQFESLYGQIHGVYHTAGVKGEGLIRFKTKEKALGVLKPKLSGTNVLEEVFSGRELDFMMLFSSLVTVTEDAGQSDYIAANRYLDAYADWAVKQYPNRKTISVHWDNWKFIGMAHRAVLENPSRKTFFEDAIAPGQAMKIMEQALACEETQLIVSVGNLYERKQRGGKNNQEQLVKEALKDNTKYDRPELSTPYVAPESEIEKHIATIWAEAFSLKTIGIQDDFFELGGDSLYAIGIVNELKKHYQMDMTDIYNYPTIQVLARKLESRSFDLLQQLEEVKKRIQEIKNTQAREVEMQEEKERYQVLWKPYTELSLTETKVWKQILLLGGSGYLGIYLLKEIVMKTDAQVVLIVRVKNGMTGKERIAKKFRAYFGEETCQQYEDRWLVLDGEIHKENFGLDYSVYWELAKSTECIVNASGKVDHYGEYEAFYEANVESVKQMISFAQTGCKKEIHHMSTKGVGTGKIDGRKTIFYTESDTDFGQTFENYYVDTKHQAEQLLAELRKKGVNVNLYRIGDIVYDSVTGHFQENIEKNAVYLLMQSILKLDCLPTGLPAFMEFTCIDFVAKAVVGLMSQAKLEQETYHLLNPNMLKLEDLEPALRNAGFEMEYKEGDKFIQYLVDNYDEKGKKEAIQNFLTYSHLLDLPIYTEFVMATEKTCCLLEKLGLVWQKPDVESLGRMIQYGQKTGFFPIGGDNGSLIV